MNDLNNDIFFLPTKNQERIIVYIEAEIQSKEQINIYFDYLENLANKQPFHYIIDLSNAGFPSTEVRNQVKLRLKLLLHLTLSYSVYVGKNILMKVAIKFVGASIGLNKFKVFNSIEDAHQNILNKN